MQSNTVALASILLLQGYLKGGHRIYIGICIIMSLLYTALQSNSTNHYCLYNKHIVEQSTEKL